MIPSCGSSLPKLRGSIQQFRAIRNSTPKDAILDWSWCAPRNSSHDSRPATRHFSRPQTNSSFPISPRSKSFRARPLHLIRGLPRRWKKRKLLGRCLLRCPNSPRRPCRPNSQTNASYHRRPPAVRSKASGSKYCERERSIPFVRSRKGQRRVRQTKTAARNLRTRRLSAHKRRIPRLAEPTPCCRPCLHADSRSRAHRHRTIRHRRRENLRHRRRRESRRHRHRRRARHAGRAPDQGRI